MRRTMLSWGRRGQARASLRSEIQDCLAFTFLRLGEGYRYLGRSWPLSSVAPGNVPEVNCSRYF